MEIYPDNNPIWLLNSIATATIVLPVVASMVRHRRLSPPLKVLSWFLFYSALNTMLTSWLAVKGMNNLQYINIFFIVELTLLGWVFHNMFEGRGMKTFIAIAVLSGVVFGLINLFLWQGFLAINSYSMGMASLVLTILALLFYYKIFQEEKVQWLERYPLFWFNSGVLLYFAGNGFLFICSSYVLVEGSALNIEWSIHSVLLIMSNLIYTTAFLLCPKQLA